MSSGYVYLSALLAVSACGTPHPGRSSTGANPANTVDLAPAPEEHAWYEIRHRETRQIDEEAPRVFQTRTVLEVLAVLPDGSRRVRARLFRATGEDELADEVTSFTLSATGRVLGEPSRECGDVAELHLGRYLRHLFGARAFLANDVGEGSRWRASYLSDAAELASPATFRLDQLGTAGAQGRLLAHIELEQGDVGDVRVLGTGRVQGRFTVSLRDGFAGRTRLATEVRGHIQSADGERRGRLRTTSVVDVRRIRARDEPTLSCGIDPEIVTQLIRTNIPEIQACYVRRLAQNPTLSGRMRVRFTVLSSGRFRETRVRENTTSDPLLGLCVTDVISTFRLRPGPVGGAVSFEYPFVFAPQN